MPSEVNNRRDFKFRAWFPKAKRMLHFDEVVIDDEYDRLAISLVDSDAKQRYRHLAGESYIPNEPFELMQYTGLLDRNSKEIYEGDIVTLGEMSKVFWQGKVEMKNGCWTARINRRQTPILSNFIVEVMGNVYSSPELLG